MQPELVATYRRYFPLIVRKCTRMLGNVHEAQDVAQEAFLRLHGSELLLTDGRAITAWLYRTSTRLAIDRLRERARHTRDEDALDGLGHEASPEVRAHVAGLWAELVRRLPRSELEAALLSHVDGLKQMEIAEVLGVDERTVRRLLSKFDERAARLRARSER
jgi:RNA polymerase sigma-70 factor (ECF subfamily)